MGLHDRYGEGGCADMHRGIFVQRHGRPIRQLRYSCQRLKLSTIAALAFVLFMVLYFAWEYSR